MLARGNLSYIVTKCRNGKLTLTYKGKIRSVSLVKAFSEKAL